MLQVKLLHGIQHVAAVLALLVAGRFSFVEMRIWGEPSESAPWVRGNTSHAAEQGDPTHPAEMVKLASQTREQTLQQFKDELASASPLGLSAPPPPAVQQRHIFVDFGPPRSNVYIAGKLVGKTPFGGQISCVAGKPVEVTVLPEQGAPLLRTYECLMEPKPAASVDSSSVLGPGTDVSNLKPPVTQ